jgi:uncharacterized membrane protein
MSEKDNGKVVAVVSYLTIIGWVIAYFMNSSNKTELGSFHIRQSFGLVVVQLILSIVASFLPSLYSVFGIAGLVVFVFQIIGFIGAIQESTNPVPLIGAKLQSVFSSIG